MGNKITDNLRNEFETEVNRMANYSHAQLLAIIVVELRTIRHQVKLVEIELQSIRIKMK